MGKDYMSMAKEGLMMFMCASVGLYFMFATFYSIKHEVKRDDAVSLDMYRQEFGEEN